MHDHSNSPCLLPYFVFEGSLLLLLIPLPNEGITNNPFSINLQRIQGIQSFMRLSLFLEFLTPIKMHVGVKSQRTQIDSKPITKIKSIMTQREICCHCGFHVSLNMIFTGATIQKRGLLTPDSIM